MTFDEVLDQVRELLQSRGRVAYRALRRRFTIDDEYIEDLKAELIKAEGVAVDENGEVLVWKDNLASSVQGLASEEQRPSVTGPTLDPRLSDSRRAEGERRQLTVMFCDLVGSTALSAQLDPEELREVVRSYQRTGAEIIERYSGHVAQYLGDGLLVYFGYPRAHEDDAARAVRAGLEIAAALPQDVEARRRRASTDPGTPLSLHVRIGIHTGLVVVGEMGDGSRQEQLALGETPNIAARIQGQAKPDEVMISAATHRLVEGLFTCEDRGQPELKGISTPLTLYHVIKEGEAHSRFEVVVRKGLTQLIGREHELGLLQERWERVKEGVGQVVLLSGEPGIGKSRLVEALKETVEPEGGRFLELRCSPYTQNSALAPVIEHLQWTLQLRPEDSVEEKLQKLIVGAQHAAPLQNDAVPLLAALLWLPHPEGYPPLTFSPQRQKEKTHEALVAWLCAEAKQRAVVYAWEDLHWADPSTLEFLTLFLQQIPTTRLLTVLTFRPEFTPPWGAHSYLSQLSLSRLGRNHIETMVEKVTSGHSLPADVVQQIVSKTDGVPLFVEELTKSVVETVGAQYDAPLGQIGVPTTLHDALMARLDRLGAAKEIAQLGATLGREFSYELLHAVSRRDEASLQQELRQLVDSELVFQNGAPPQARYLFKHALVQDTAYHSLLKSRRQQLHQRIGKVLEDQFPQTVETQAELVAHHYTEASLIEQAIPYWQQAGQRAAQRSANAEAIGHLTKGLELLKTLPDSPERIQQELMLQITLGVSLMATKGYSAPEVGETYTRARELCRHTGEIPQLFPVLRGMQFFYLVRAEYKTARELAEQLFTLAQRTQDSSALLEAHVALGLSSFWLGEFASARAHLEQGIALYDSQQHRVHAFRYGQDPGLVCLFYMALVLWHLGYPDQALKRSREVLSLARELPHSLSVAFALVFTAVFYQFRREVEATQEQAEVAIALSTEQGFPWWVGLGSILRGWALVEQGKGEEGIVQIHQGLASLRAAGTEVGRPYRLAMLVEAYKQGAQPAAGLNVLVEALVTAEKTGELMWEAELYRLKGELLLMQAEKLRD